MTDIYGFAPAQGTQVAITEYGQGGQGRALGAGAGLGRCLEVCWTRIHHGGMHGGHKIITGECMVDTTPSVLG